MLRFLNSFFYLLVLILFTASCKNWNAEKVKPVKVINHQASEQKLGYDTVPNDPSQTRVYQLSNGLTVYLSPNNVSPRIHTLISVNAGSVNDPSDATGLAHYLEHMLFKGTDSIGTVNYEKEKILIDLISNKFEDLRATNDSVKRKKIYLTIDSLSQEAAQYAAPNELTQMFQSIGADKTNAFTSHNYTGYINDIPSNQIENWLYIERERFRNPVLRLFHTELEAVYEEKNMGLDKPDRQAYYKMMEALFPNHNYGQQTTIGTVEHLKSPSMKEIHEFYNKHYVPNNMAVHLAGDFNPDSTIQLIEKYFGHWVPEYVAPYQPEKEKPIKEKKVVEMETSEAPKFSMAYRFDNDNKDHQFLATMVDMILSNSTAGLIDLNINQPKKAIGAYSYHYPLKDYTLHVMGGQPTKGQTLEELETLIKAELEKVKNGDFPNWLPKAIINNLKADALKGLRSNRNRTYATLDAFSKNMSWKEKVNYHNNMAKYSKEDIVRFAQENYSDNYVAVYLRKVDSTERLAVEKPPITPITGIDDNQSIFTKNFYKKAIEKPIEPDFIDFEKAISRKKINTTVELLYRKNTRDELFDFTVYYPRGSYQSKTLKLAADLFKRCGTDSLSVAQINQQWYKMGVDFSIGVSDDETYVSFNGLSSQLKPSLELFNHLLKKSKVDTTIWKAVLQSTIQSRENAVNSKENVMWGGLKDFLVYGEDSPIKHQLSNEALVQLNPNELLDEVKSLLTVPNQFSYYGADEINKVESYIDSYFNLRSSTKSISDPFFRLPTDETEIFFIDQNSQQAEILLLSNGVQMKDEEWAVHELFNEYFGGSMSSVVFQEMREKQALAYSVYAGYSSPKKKNDPRYVIGYIGTQADKYHEAMKGLLQLMSDLPIDTVRFEQSRKAIIQSIESKRYGEYSIINAYLGYKERGVPFNKNEMVYNDIKKITIQDMIDYFNKYVSNQNYRIGIMGPKSIIDFEKLEEFGKVTEIQKENLFPY